MKTGFSLTKMQEGVLGSLILVILAGAYIGTLYVLGITGYIIIAVFLPVILSAYNDVGRDRDAQSTFPTWCVSLMENSISFGFRVIFINGILGWVFANWKPLLIVTAWLAYRLIDLIMKITLSSKTQERFQGQGWKYECE